MHLVIHLVSGEEYVVDPKEFEATDDGATTLRSAIHGNIGVSLSDESRDAPMLRIWPEPSNVAFVGLRSESDRLGGTRRFG